MSTLCCTALHARTFSDSSHARVGTSVQSREPPPEAPCAARPRTMAAGARRAGQRRPQAGSHRERTLAASEHLGTLGGPSCLHPSVGPCHACNSRRYSPAATASAGRQVRRRRRRGGAGGPGHDGGIPGAGGPGGARTAEAMALRDGCGGGKGGGGREGHSIGIAFRGNAPQTAGVTSTTGETGHCRTWNTQGRPMRRIPRRRRGGARCLVARSCRRRPSRAEPGPEIFPPMRSDCFVRARLGATSAVVRRKALGDGAWPTGTARLGTDGQGDVRLRSARAPLWIAEERRSGRQARARRRRVTGRPCPV
jgi:hypothetical protein